MEIEFENNSSFEIEPNQFSNFSLEINKSGLAKGPKGDKGEVGPQGPKGEPGNPNAYMEYIDLSTDMENPTDILNYVDKSGIYVAKNKGIVGFAGEPFTVLAPGQFFEVQNMKDLAEIVPDSGIDDENNEITIAMPNLEGYMFYVKISNDEVNNSVNITSANINDYVNIDTSNLITRGMINSAYGIQITNNQLSISGATLQEIDAGRAIYKPITAQYIEYAVKQKGLKHFSTKEELKEVQDNVDKLIYDIESALDTMVSV